MQNDVAGIRPDPIETGTDRNPGRHEIKRASCTRCTNRSIRITLGFCRIGNQTKEREGEEKRNEKCFSIFHNRHIQNVKLIQ